MRANLVWVFLKTNALRQERPVCFKVRSIPEGCPLCQFWSGYLFVFMLHK